MKKKICFIKLNSKLIFDQKLEESLKLNFSEYEFSVFTIEDVLIKQPFVIILNWFITLAMYGFDIIRRIKRPQQSFWRTPFIFKHVRKTISQNICQGEYVFTFQAQSLFDCKTAGTPHFLYTDHTHLANLSYPKFDIRELYSKKWVELEKEIYQHTDIIFVWSTNIAESLVKQYGQPRNRVARVNVGGSIDFNHFNIDPNKKFSKNILFIGSDWKRKGGPDLMIAFQKVLIKHPDAFLTIAGSSPKLSHPRCSVLGPLPVEKLKPLYEKADIFCMPTLLEPFGIVYLEAMAAGLPVIGTRLGATQDFIKNGWNGFIVECGNTDQIAEALISLLDNPDECKTFGKRGRQIVKEQYTWDIVGKNIRHHILGLVTQPTQLN